MFITLWFPLLREPILHAAEKSAYQPAALNGGEMKYVDGIPVLVLRGSPEAMGRQQAAIVGPTIRRLLGVPRAVLDGRGDTPRWPAAIKIASTLMGRAPERHRRELDALAVALKTTEDEKAALLVANVLAELRRAERCSALIVEPERSVTGKVLFGRNYDFYTFGVLDRLSLVTVYRPQGFHAFASVGYPGSVGVMSGMNDVGLTVACLDSGPAKDHSLSFDPRGDPMLITFRRVLEECATIEDAHKLLGNTKHTTWFNLAVCDKRRAMVLEITPKQVVARRAEDHLLACTNDFRTPALAVSTDSDRYATLSRLGAQHDRFTWSDVASAMHDVNLGNRTLQTMVFEPDSLLLRLSIYRRPASAGPLVSLKLQSLLGQHDRPPSARH